jgi:hypothetical protein
MNTPVPDLWVISDVRHSQTMSGIAAFNEDGQVEAHLSVSNFDGFAKINMDVTDMKNLRNWLNLCIESAEKHQRETL